MRLGLIQRDEENKERRRGNVDAREPTGYPRCDPYEHKSDRGTSDGGPTIAGHVRSLGSAGAPRDRLLARREGVGELAGGDRQLGDFGQVGAEGAHGPVRSIGRLGGDAEPAEGDGESPHPDVGEPVERQ